MPCPGYKHTAEAIEKIRASNRRRKSPWLGRKHSAETKAKIGNAHRGRKHSWGAARGDANPACRPEVRAKMSATRKGRNFRSAAGLLRLSETMRRLWSEGKIVRKQVSRKGKPLLAMRGENNPNWRGGITAENDRVRASLEYIEWRRSVMARDNWTCLLCSRRGGEMHADHIKPFWKFPELRFALNNGRTLCRPCHRKTPTYGVNALKYVEVAS